MTPKSFLVAVGVVTVLAACYELLLVLLAATIPLVLDILGGGLP